MDNTNRVESISRRLAGAAAALTILVIAACTTQTPPSSPTPTPDNPTTANAYILPGAQGMGPNAFGDEPVVIHKGERLRWRNADSVEHDVVADAATLPEFRTTGVLAPGDERSFVMNTVGTTAIHCTIHPTMTGTLVVREP